MTSIVKVLKTSFLMRFFKTFIKEFGNKERTNREAFIDSHFPHVSIEKKKALSRDMRKRYVINGYTYEEYWQFKFDVFSRNQLRKMVPIVKINRFYDFVNNEEGMSHLLFDKWKTYLLYKDLYKRDVCLIRKGNDGFHVESDVNEFQKFVEKHNAFIVKPLSLDSGIGVKKICLREREEAIELAQRCSDDTFIAEELIVQNEKLARYNSSSVNTLRTNTVYYNENDIEIFRPIMRFGNGTAIVDNAHFGGMYAVVDAKTGKMTHAGDLDRHTYINHPYTNVPIVGESIPMWEEACELSREAARRLPDHVFTGWDLALTDSGWVLVEGNAKPGLLDSALTGIGPRDELNRIKKRVKEQRRRS